MGWKKSTLLWSRSGQLKGRIAILMLGFPQKMLSWCCPNHKVHLVVKFQTPFKSCQWIPDCSSQHFGVSAPTSDITLNLISITHDSWNIYVVLLLFDLKAFSTTCTNSPSVLLWDWKQWIWFTGKANCWTIHHRQAGRQAGCRNREPSFT